MKKHLLFIHFIVTALLISFVAPAISTTFAQSSPSPTTVNNGQALEVGPPVIVLKSDPGETVKAQIKIRDISSSELVVTGEVNDFVADGENGTPKILLEKGETSPYSMKSWVKPLQKLQLKPGDIQTLTVDITVPKNVSPGGYYGVVRFSGKPPGIEGTGVALSASVGVLILFTVNGEVNHDMQLKSLTVAPKDSENPQSLFESAPFQFIERVENKGTVHEQPSGVITIRDMFGNGVAGIAVNQPPRNVLPKSTRKFTQVIDSSLLNDKFLFGYYTATLELTYAGNKAIGGQVGFWVIPYRLILAVIVGLIALFFIIRFIIHRHNQRVISKVAKSRRR